MRRLIFLILLLGISGWAAAESAGSARDVVVKLDNALIEVMKNAKALGYQGRVDVLTPVVLETHDFEAIAKLAVGKHWKTLEDQEKSDLVKKLTDYSIATYAAQFDGYAGEEFKYDSEETVKERVMVRYVLAAPGEQDHKFEYVMNQADGQWRIINIIVDGISDLALKRAQYESVIEKEGFAKLMQRLSDKIADYAKTRAQPSSS